MGEPPLFEGGIEGISMYGTKKKKKKRVGFLAGLIGAISRRWEDEWSAGQGKKPYDWSVGPSSRGTA